MSIRPVWLILISAQITIIFGSSYHDFFCKIASAKQSISLVPCKLACIERLALIRGCEVCECRESLCAKPNAVQCQPGFHCEVKTSGYFFVQNDVTVCVPDKPVVRFADVNYKGDANKTHIQFAPPTQRTERKETVTTAIPPNSPTETSTLASTAALVLNTTKTTNFQNEVIKINPNGVHIVFAPRFSDNVQTSAASNKFSELSVTPQTTPQPPITPPATAESVRSTDISTEPLIKAKTDIDSVNNVVKINSNSVHIVFEPRNKDAIATGKTTTAKPPTVAENAMGTANENTDIKNAAIDYGNEQATATWTSDMVKEILVATENTSPVNIATEPLKTEENTTSSVKEVVNINSNNGHIVFDPQKTDQPRIIYRKVPSEKLTDEPTNANTEPTTHHAKFNSADEDFQINHKKAHIVFVAPKTNQEQTTTTKTATQTSEELNTAKMTTSAMNSIDSTGNPDVVGKQIHIGTAGVAGPAVCEQKETCDSSESCSEVGYLCRQDGRCCKSGGSRAKQDRSFARCHIRPSFIICPSKGPRFVFDIAVSRCVETPFGGCDNSRNVFESMEECQDHCEMPCKQPQSDGPCRRNMPRYYFNETTMKCQIFDYGGCEDYGNNFESAVECELHCRGATNTAPSVYSSVFDNADNFYFVYPRSNLRSTYVYPYASGISSAITTTETSAIRLNYRAFLAKNFNRKP